MLRSLKDVLRFKRFEKNPAQRRLNKAANIADLRTIAQRRLPGGVFDYIDGAAEDERTLRDNVSAFSNYKFKPRVLRDVSNIDSSAKILGTATPLPLICAPTGFTRIAHSDGELAVSRSAAKAEIPFSLSTMATRSIEEIHQTTKQLEEAQNLSPRNWFQVYVWKDRGLLRDLLDRANEADFEAIVITVDTAVLGRRERDVERRLAAAAAVLRVGARREQRARADRQVVRRHPMERRHPVRVERLDVAAARDEERGRALVVAAHAAHVERLRAARRDVVHQVGPLVEEGGDGGVVAERAVDRRVAAARVHRAGARVVVLVLAADDDVPARVALDDAAVDPRAHRVAVRVEALGVRLADRAVLLGHARREGIVGDAHAVGTVVLAAHRRRGHQDALEDAEAPEHARRPRPMSQG